MLSFLLALVFLAAPEVGVSTPEALLGEILPGLASTDSAQIDGAWRALERACFEAGRPGAENERKALSLAIAAKLGADVPESARVIFLRALEIVGKGEAVPALAKLIAPGNPSSIREGARRALDTNPHVNAKKALRHALGQAEGSLRVGVIHSLGVRRDFLATGDLIGIAEDSDLAAKLAAVEALAEIGDVSAVPVVEEALSNLKGPELAVAQRAYLRLADSLVRNDERGQARRIYDKAARISPAHKAAALIGFARAGLQSEIERIASALDDPDPQVGGAAVEAASRITGDGMTKALLVRLERDPSVKLLRILARRRGPGARAALLNAARNTQAANLRLEALRLFGDFSSDRDGRDAIDLLLSALGEGGEVDRVVETTLSRMRGPVTVTIAEQLGKASGDRKLALIRVLGARREVEGLQALESAASDASLPVRTAALQAIGQVGQASSVALLLGILVKAGDAERGAAIGALARLCGDESSTAIVAAFARAEGADRAVLLRVIALRRDPGSVDRLKKAAGEPSSLVRLAAIEGLGFSNDLSALPILLEVIEKGTEAEQSLALRGALRFGDQIARDDRSKALAIYLKALDISEDPKDLSMALRGIAETSGPENLKRILPHLKKGPLQREAGRAALRLAQRLPEDQQAGAKEVYELVLALDPDHTTASQCVRRLRRLGVDVDLARKRGFVTRWWILAPFPNPQGSLWEKALPPESGVDLTKPVESEGEKYEWKMYHTPSPRGVIDLADAGYSSEFAGAYLYAEISVKSACDALFKMGSDDQIACWLNGVKVHAYRASRGLEVDKDTVEVKLTEGVNRILLKILNDTLDWGACLRITDRAGKPLDFAQKES